MSPLFILGLLAMLTQTTIPPSPSVASPGSQDQTGIPAPGDLWLLPGDNDAIDPMLREWR